jgi:hypothetical protein
MFASWEAVLLPVNISVMVLTLAGVERQLAHRHPSDKPHE